MTAALLGLGKKSTRRLATVSDSGNSAGVPEPLAPACAAHVDTGEDHGQLRRLEFDAVALGSARHLEGAASSRLYQIASPSRSK